MSTVIQHPQNAYFIIASGSSTELGSFDNTTWGDLSIAHLRIFHKKVGAYSYQMRLVVSSKQFGPALVASDYVEFSNATTLQVGNDWLGDVTFSFPEYRLVNGEEYFVRLETTGYTRPARPLENTAYLGVWVDWFEPVGNTNAGGARIAFGVRR